MTQHIITSMVSRINFSPATVAEEVVQNVRTILATQIGTVPLFRDFGVSWEGIDRPLPVARAIVRAAVIDAVQRFEPRAVVDSVEWSPDTEDALQGLLHPVVTISLADGVEDAAVAAETGVTISAVYQQADRGVSLATSLVALEKSIADRVVELEVTNYVRIFDLANASWKDDGSVQPVPGVGAVSGSALLDTVAMMIDSTNTVAAQVSADVGYYTKILHEFERIEYASVYTAGSVVHDPFEVSPVEPSPIVSASGVTDLDELNVLASSAYAAAISARDALLDLERLLGQFERTAFTSIYETKE